MLKRGWTCPNMPKWLFLIVQLLKDELRNEQRHYEHFLLQGHAILDKTDPDSSDAELVSRRLEDVNVTWDRLAGWL